MNDTERQALLTILDQRLANAQGALFDALDDARLALSEWDLQGDIPYEAQLREWGVLEEAAGVAEPPPPAPGGLALPTPEQLEMLMAGLHHRIRSATAGSEAHVLARSVRQKLQAWDGHPPLPHAAELEAWGLWPPRPVAETLIVSPPVEAPPAPAADPDEDLRPEFEAARSLLAAQPYEAIRRLSALQARARGSLIDRLSAELTQAQMNLENRTAALVAKAQRVAQESPNDVSAQEAAWLAVIALNPESREGQEALNQLKAKVQLAVEADLIRIEEKAEEAAQQNKLPPLHDCRADIAALCARTDLPEALRARAQAVQTAVSQWLEETRGRVGVSSTLAGQEKWRESYIEARACMESDPPILVIVDTANLLGRVAGAEVPTGDLLNAIADKYISVVKGDVARYRSDAQKKVRDAPKTALDYLHTARGWLTEQVSIKDINSGKKRTIDLWAAQHRAQLAETLATVDREIADAERTWATYQEVEKQINAARQIGIPPQEQVQQLLEAQTRYPEYPNIAQYIEEARKTLSISLAGQVRGQITDARAQVEKEAFADARQILAQAEQDATRDIPAPPPDSQLARALEELRQEKLAIDRAENALTSLQDQLARVKAALDAYDESRDLLHIQEARALLDEIPENFRQHPQVVETRALITARQGDAENFASGQQAYQQRNWVAAWDYFGKVKAGDNVNAAMQLGNRARAAMFAEAALACSAALTAKEDWEQLLNSGLQDAALEQRAADTMEAARALLKGQVAQQMGKEVTWTAAFEGCKEAVYLFEQNGEDERTAALATACRKEKERLDQIHQQDETLAPLLTQARADLKQAQARNQQSLPLFARLEPLPETFKASVTALEAALYRTSLINDEITSLLAMMRAAWRQAYLPALREVLKDEEHSVVETAQISNVRQLAEELRNANLLFQADNDLYYQVRKLQLDRALQLLEEAGSEDWKAIETNRRELLNLPGLEEAQKQAARSKLQEACAKRIRAEFDAKRADAGAAAALAFLAEKLRSGDIQPDRAWLEIWITLCWEKQDWSEAESVAQRFGALETDQQKRAGQLVFWQGLTVIARAYAEDNLAAAESHAADLRKKVTDTPELTGFSSRLDGFIKEFKAATVKRLIADTPANPSSPDAKPEDYLPIAQGYANIKQLEPDNTLADKGLQDISGNLRPMITQLRMRAENLKIDSKGLEKARDRAVELQKQLHGIEAILPYLKPSGGQGEAQTQWENDKLAFEAAKEALDAKWQRWINAIAQLAYVKEEVTAALGSPSPLRKEAAIESYDGRPQPPVFTGGGWNFDDARGLLNTLKTQASKDKDAELQALVDGELETLTSYETTANNLRKSVCELLEAIYTETFEEVPQKVQALEIAWKQAPGQAGWGGLEDRLLKHTYLYPQPQTRSKLQEHRAFALQQQVNLREWVAHEKKVTSLYTALTGGDKYEDLLGEDLDGLIIRLSLADIIQRSEEWEKEHRDFLKILEQTTTFAAPLSEKAEEIRKQVDYDRRKERCNACLAHVQQLREQARHSLASPSFLDALGRLRQRRDDLTQSRKRPPTPSEADQGLIRGWYKTCVAIDPLNKEIKGGAEGTPPGLRKQLEGYGYRFEY